MSQTSWHVSPEVLGRYYDDPASVDDVTASSIEAHLVACAMCRAELSGHAPVAWVAASWDDVADQVDRPRRGALEWALDGLGMHSGIARLVTATPALRLAGLLATLLIAAAAYRWLQAWADATGDLWTEPSGWRVGAAAPYSLRLRVGERTDHVRISGRPAAAAVVVESGESRTLTASLAGSELTLTLGGVRRRYTVATDAQEIWLAGDDGSAVVTEIQE